MKKRSGSLKIALPKGRLLPPTADLLEEAKLGLDGYDEETRHYRLSSTVLPYLSAKIFQEKDIAVQVAVGNYDLGICGLDWVEELLARYKASGVVKVATLSYGEGSVYAAASRQTGRTGPLADKPNRPSTGSGRTRETLLPFVVSLSNHERRCKPDASPLARGDSLRLVSEYPNLAEAFALNMRLKRFRIFPVWGDAEVYPPEDAEIAVLWAKDEKGLKKQALFPLVKLLPVNAVVIANQESLENKELEGVLNRLAPGRRSEEHFLSFEELGGESPAAPLPPRRAEGKVRLALPDGHQLPPTAEFLKHAGLSLSRYCPESLDYRPSADLDWLAVKVIRPQDMPLQVANGNFDLAITGRDWLFDHLYRFPSSPVAELLDLGFGRVKIVAAVSQEMPASTIEEVKRLLSSRKLAVLRVASEYVNIGDRYLCDRHISPYKLIPTWGASEAFLPEDADLLIDNMQTGKTMAEHNLKIIDELGDSTACLISNREGVESPDKITKIDLFINMLRRGL